MTSGPAAIRSTETTLRKRAARALSGAAFAGCLVAAAAMLALPLAGYERYVITGGSMSGSIERGALLWSEEVPTAQLKVGDVITYTPPRGTGPTGLVTHRIVSIDRATGGRPLYRTKGDANAAADPWTFELGQPTQARAVLDIPYAGYPLHALRDPQTRMVVLGLPAILIALMMLARLWRDAGQAARVARAQELTA